jgi:hypothetical protein
MCGGRVTGEQDSVGEVHHLVLDEPLTADLGVRQPADQVRPGTRSATSVLDP